jgi:predicted nuclease of predicted toxin-antitoxin system
MKLLLDQNISPKLVDSLSNLYSGSIHVQEADMDKSTDEEIWIYAKLNDFIIISKDADFAERSLLLGFPPFVVWIRKGNCTTSEIKNTLVDNYELISSFISASITGLLNLY